MLEYNDYPTNDEDSDRFDLEIAVLLQLLQDINVENYTGPLEEWLSHLDDECLLHYLPPDHHMFEGLREEKTVIPEWLKTVPYVFNDEYIGDTIGRN